MVRIKIGNQTDRSKLRVLVETFTESPLELTIGHQSGMSERELILTEQHRTEIDDRIFDLREEIEKLKREAKEGDRGTAIALEATKIADTAAKIVKERKWYSVSGAGVIEAAGAVGKATSAVVKTSLDIIDLLNRLKG